VTKAQWRKRQAQWERFHRWEEQQIRAMSLTPRAAFRIFDQLYEGAQALGAFRTFSGAREEEGTAVRIAAIVNRQLRRD